MISFETLNSPFETATVSFTVFSLSGSQITVAVPSEITIADSSSLAHSMLVPFSPLVGTENDDHTLDSIVIAARSVVHATKSGSGILANVWYG